MRATLLTAFLFVAYARAYVEVQTEYHQKIGIPLAERIKAEEDSILFGRNANNVEDNRIVGGSIAPTNAHPYLAGLLITFVNILGTSACGASLLSANRLVTAAHCWFDGVNQANQFTVVLGSNFLFSGGIRIPTNQVFLHPQWTPSFLTNDVAMIYLPTRVSFTASIQPIALPSQWDLNNMFVGEWGIAAGYGITSDSQTGITINQVVSQVNLQVITVAQCAAVFGSNFVRNSNICTNGAGGVGICRGDSGGPLVIFRNGQPTLVGISSFVANIGCQLGFPSAFARVTSFHSFITQHL